MQLACPHCGTREIKVSSGRGIGEIIKSLCGIYQLRCRRCRTRWETSTWADGAWKYARCPRCYRQELTTWSLKYYNPPSSTLLKLQLGAKRYRCAACRCNFASFRPCRDNKEWRLREPGESGRGTGALEAPSDD
jgi:hypothetical protein